MEYAAADEAGDMGEYTEVDTEFFASVCDLFDMFQTDFAPDDLDYAGVAEAQLAQTTE